MSDDWSQQEVEIIVEDYLAMLEMELRDQEFNKAERNRDLRVLLPKRNRGSVEFKHQNISAVLLEMGYPYVQGYKPRRNYQHLLSETVERAVYSKPDLAKTLSKYVERPAHTPTNIDDLLSILVDPPSHARRREAVEEISFEPKTIPRRNYLEIETRNQSLGRAGEELVLKFEHERLWRAGHKTLAERVEHVSASKGDGLGFDILSFEPDGQERLVEVKTTRFGAMTPFFASANEVKVSENRSAEYHVYRLFSFERNPRLFMLSGSMGGTCNLEAVQYRATPGLSGE